MDRRNAIATIMGRSKTATTSTFDGKQEILLGLPAYSGTWGYEQASHLLRRTIFGPTYAQMQTAVTDGLDVTVAQLLAPVAMPSPPVFYEEGHPNIGEVWVDLPYNNDDNPFRVRSLSGWSISQLISQGISIREKMVLFWHNHFAVSNEAIFLPRAMYYYFTLLRQNALGDFKQMVKDITVDPAMLRFLNGSGSTKWAPNENYARELLELFTVGKGDLAGEGDYTTFTEQDVAEMAKILTGWYAITYNNEEPTGVMFYNSDHTEGDKQLSHRFNNAVVSENGDQEYADLIDVIFAEQGLVVAKHICRKLYRWFAHSNLTSDVEQNVISPMADLLVMNNFTIEPVVETLLKSQHFYEECQRGSMVKNPIDYVLCFVKQMDFAVPTDLSGSYYFWNYFRGMAGYVQMDYLSPPNVAGWKAYYQEPALYKVWINSTTLRFRRNLYYSFFYGYEPAWGDDRRIEVLDFIATINNPSDADAVIEEFAKILFPQALPASQRDDLKAVLLSGAPLDNSYWYEAYTNYENDPLNLEYRTEVENRLRNLLVVMLQMPEFHLM